MKALVKTKKGAGNWEILDKPEPVVGEGQVKVRVEYIAEVISIRLKGTIMLMLKV